MVFRIFAELCNNYHYGCPFVAMGDWFQDRHRYQYPRMLKSHSQVPVCGSASIALTNLGSCNTVCIYWKKKSAYKWTNAVQTHVVQGSTVYNSRTFILLLKETPDPGNSLVVQWLGLHALTTKGAKGPGSITGQGTKIPQVARGSQKRKKKETPNPLGHFSLPSPSHWHRSSTFCLYWFACSGHFFLSFSFYYFLAALGLRCCVWAFSSCGERGLLLCGGPASHCGGFSCCGAQALGVWASVVVACGLSSCGAWA